MKLVGNLTEQGCSFDAALDTTDIIYDPLTTVKENEVTLSDGFMGLRVRGEFPVNIEVLNISRIKNDAVQLWNGGLSVERLEVNHTTPALYCNSNHPDVLQAFAKMHRAPFHMLDVFDGLYIGYAKCVIESFNADDKKNGFVFTELCKYQNINLFSKGLDFKSDSSAPYFLDSTNFTNTVLGSQDFPLDPAKVSGKALRIGGQKKGAPDCENIVIHAYEGLEIILSEQAEKATSIIRYEKPIIRQMSSSGIKSLIKSEGSVATIYKDSAGLNTVGVGHLLTHSENTSGKIQLENGDILYLDNPLTSDEMERLLQSDLVRFCKAVDEYVKVEINQGQFDALVHIAFNIGTGALKKSTLLRRVNASDFDNVPDAIRMWNIITVNGQKKISKGLVNRREKECEMWCKASESELDISEYLTEGEKVAAQEVIEYQYPIAKDHEVYGTNKEEKSLWWSRIFGGTTIGGGSLLGGGGILAYIQQKISGLTESVINDPSGATANIAQTVEEVTVNAERVINATADLKMWIAWLGVLLLITFGGLLWALYARIDDRRNGIN